MPRQTRNSQLGNQDRGGYSNDGNGGDDRDNRRDEKPRDHAEPYNRAFTRPAKRTGAILAHPGLAYPEVYGQPRQLPPIAMIPHPVMASINDAQRERKILPPIVTPSVDKTKPPSISFSNLPVPAKVKEIKIKADRLPNGYSFVLTWDDAAVLKLEDAIKSIDEGVGVKSSSHLEREEMRRQDDNNGRGGGIA